MTRQLKGAGNSNREQVGWPQQAASPESLQMRGPGSYWASSPWKLLFKQRRNQLNKKTETESMAMDADVFSITIRARAHLCR